MSQLGFQEVVEEVEETEVIQVTGQRIDRFGPSAKSLYYMDLRMRSMQEQAAIQAQRLEELEAKVSALREANRQACVERRELAAAFGVSRCDDLARDIQNNRINCAGVGTAVSIAWSQAFGGGGRRFGRSEIGALATSTCSFIQGNSNAAGEAHASCMLDLQQELDSLGNNLNCP